MLQSCYRKHPKSFAILTILFAEWNRTPHFGVTPTCSPAFQTDGMLEMKTGWQYADDRMRPAIQGERFADDIGYAVEVSLPKCVTDHHNVMLAGHRRLRSEISSERRLNPQHGKEIYRGHARLEPFRNFHAGEIKIGEAQGSNIAEGDTLLAPIKIARRRRDGQLICFRRIRPRNDHKFIGILIRDLAEQH